MTWNELLTLWSANATLSVAVWLVIIVAALYLARQPAHHFLRTAARTLARQARAIGVRARRQSDGARRRARLSLLQLARENVERAMEHQVERLTAVMRRDLASFPHLHHQVHEQLTRIDEDYRNTLETPPTPPDWLEAIETIAALPRRDEPAIARMLEDLESTLERACHESVVSYRTASRRRHRILRRMQPLWRRMGHSMNALRRAMQRLNARADRLDEQVRLYERILSARPSVVRRLAASLSVRTLLSLAALGGIAAAAVVDFHLIARPLEEVGGGLGAIWGIPFTQVLSAMVLILLVLTGGVFLESARVTRLFPEVGWMEDPMRRLLATGAAIVILMILTLSATLAWMRDYLLAVDQFDAGVSGSPAAIAALSFHWVPAITQSVLAIALGLAVAAATLPLESFVRQGRVLGLALWSVLLGLLATVLRLVAMLIVGLAQVLIAAYDLVVFLPLAAERVWRDREGRRVRVGRRPLPAEQADR